MTIRSAPALALAAFIAVSGTAFAAPAKKAATPATPEWIQRSNADAEPLLKVLGDFGPEFAARLGVKGYDDKISQFPLDASEKFRAAITGARTNLESKLAAEKDPLVQ